MSSIDPDALLAIIRAEEARIAGSLSEIAPFARPFAGGVMTRGEPGDWVNAAFGPGMKGAVEHDEVRAMIAWYESAGIEPRVELSPFADPSLIRLLAEERFVIRGFDQLFMRSLDEAGSVAPPREAPEGLLIEPIDPSDEEAVELYARTASGALLTTPVREHHLATWRTVARHPRVTAMLARLPVDGADAIVGACTLERAGEQGVLFGGAVFEPYRRRGIQQAMLIRRLRIAAERGARRATISGRPGAGTERNARRLGFELLCTKVMLARPGPGLAPVEE